MVPEGEIRAARGHRDLFADPLIVPQCRGTPVGRFLGFDVQHLAGFLAEVVLAVVERVANPPRFPFMHMPEIRDEPREIFDSDRFGEFFERFERHRC